MVRVAVAGGTGNAGRHVVAALRRDGHEAVVLSRSAGVDLISGAGLAGALGGVSAVVDATSTAVRDEAAVVEFFAAVTRNLLAAEAAAGVGHHVALSIVNVDKTMGNPHYAGKRRQEELVTAGAVPWTIARATQFHDFAATVVSWSRRDGQAVLPPLLVQPVDLGDLGAELARIAGAGPAGVIEIAGPETQDLVDMARRTLAARGETVRLVPTWAGPLGTSMAGNALLPSESARILPTTFDQWLATQGPAPRGPA